jgi:glycosyltransferase involved in cell wall biosynthesis
MSYPRVLLTTYHQAFLVSGGGEHEMYSIADALKQCGLIADIYGPYSRPIESYDAIIHFSVHGGGLEFLEYIKSFNKSVFLWPNVWLTEKDSNSLPMIKRFVELSEQLLFKSNSELENFVQYFPESKPKCNLIASGVDSSFSWSADADLFKSIQGVDRYAIWVGIIEPNKNQLGAIKAIKNKSLKLVLVGNCRDSEYLNECVQVGGDDLIIISSLPHKSELFRSALKGAEFYIEVGHEPPGLSAIEAGLCGCKLIISDSSWSREHFAEGAIYVDPLDGSSIASAIDNVLSGYEPVIDVQSKLKNYCLPGSIEPLLEMLKAKVNEDISS